MNLIEIKETKALAHANIRYTHHESPLGVNAIYVLQNVSIDNILKTMMFCKDSKHDKYYLITGVCDYIEWNCGMGAMALSDKKYYAISKNGLDILYMKILRTKHKAPSGQYHYRWIK